MKEIEEDHASPKVNITWDQGPPHKLRAQGDPEPRRSRAGAGPCRAGPSWAPGWMNVTHPCMEWRSRILVYPFRVWAMGVNQLRWKKMFGFSFIEST